MNQVGSKRIFPNFTIVRKQISTYPSLRQKKRNCPLLSFLRKLQVDACVWKQTFFLFFVLLLFSCFVWSRFRFIFIVTFILDRKLLLGFSLLRHRKKQETRNRSWEGWWEGKRVTKEGRFNYGEAHGGGVFEPFYFQTLARFHHKNMNVEPLSQP